MEAVKVREEKRISRKRIAIRPASTSSLHLSQHRDAHPYQTKYGNVRQNSSGGAKAQTSKKHSLHCTALAGSSVQTEVKDVKLKTPEVVKVFPNQQFRTRLEMDVKRLKKKLTHEMNLHRVLERAFQRPIGALPRVPHYLPLQTQELIAEVAVLEEEIVNLKDQFLTLQQALYNEAVCISAFKKQKQSSTFPNTRHVEKQSSKRTQCSAASFHGKRDPVVTRLLSSTKHTDTITSERQLENKCSNEKCAIGASEHPESPLPRLERSQTVKAAAFDCTEPPSPRKDGITEIVNESTQTSQWQESLQRRTSAHSFPTAKREEQTVTEVLCESLSNCRLDSKELPSSVAPQQILNSHILQPDQKTGPNKLSEETMKCLLSIYITMTRAYPTSDSESLSNLSLSTFSSFSSQSCGSKSSSSTKFTVGTSDEHTMPDPYGVCDSVPHDVGPYKQFQHITAASFDYGRVADCACNLRRLRDMIGKLAKVDLRDMSHHQKLAFWINIYNACMMHAFLEYGIPCSAHQVITLLHKAELNVGGHLLNVPTIERILCLPTHTNQPCTSQETAHLQHMLGLDWPEPHVIFALCCGTRSSPAVRVYTAAEVDDELELAKKEYLHAAIGFTLKQKLLIPKLLEWNLSMFAKDAESLLDWLSLQLPKTLQAHVKEYLGKANGMVSRVLQVMPYDFSFRYLLP